LVLYLPRLAVLIHGPSSKRRSVKSEGEDQARTFGLAGAGCVSCVFNFLLFRARLSGPRHADVKAVRAGSRFLRGVTS